MTIDSQALETVILATTVIGVIFSVYLHFRNPQIKSDQTIIRLKEDLETLKAVVVDVKERHLIAVDQEMKALTHTISQLSLTVTRLSTIIDERIPKK